MGENNKPELREVWQTRPISMENIDLENLKLRSDKMRRKIKIRNNIERLAAGAVALGLVPTLLEPGNAVTLFGAALTIGAMIFILVQMQRLSTSPQTVAGQAPILEQYRTELIRERDGLRGIWRWYLLPLIPGALFLTVGRGLPEQSDGRSPTPLALSLVVLFVVAAAFVAVWRLNEKGARRLQAELDALDQD